MNIRVAKKIAKKLIEELKPFCTRIEVAGSIRRGKSEVKDIEIVAIRRTSNLYGFMRWMKSQYVFKGGILHKYVQFTYGMIVVDMFFADKENWGLIYAIRTGSAMFSHKVLATGWVKKGYKSKDGVLRDQTGRSVNVYEEKDLFKLIGLKYVTPGRREL